MENKKCWCYLTYAFPMEDVPPLPSFIQPNAKLNEPVDHPGTGFEPEWFFNAKFPEDE